MSRICNGCGGILGRDCFNEMECIQISEQMRYQDNETIYTLQMENEVLKQLLIRHNIPIPAKSARNHIESTDELPF